jgi:hypothetical protein
MPATGQQFCQGRFAQRHIAGTARFSSRITTISANAPSRGGMEMIVLHLICHGQTYRRARSTCHQRVDRHSRSPPSPQPPTPPAASWPGSAVQAGGHHGPKGMHINPQIPDASIRIRLCPAPRGISISRYQAFERNHKPALSFWYIPINRVWLLRNIGGCV